MAERNANPKKDIMTFEDFQKLDLRVGEVVACERVPKADRLLNLTIRTGLDERTVLSGIAEHFEPKDVVGRRVTLLVNLAPRKIRGIESQGMVLMAETADGSLRFVTPEEGTQAGDVILKISPLQNATSGRGLAYFYRRFADIAQLVEQAHS